MAKCKIAKFRKSEDGDYSKLGLAKGDSLNGLGGRGSREIPPENRKSGKIKTKNKTGKIAKKQSKMRKTSQNCQISKKRENRGLNYSKLGVGGRRLFEWSRRERSAAKRTRESWKIPPEIGKARKLKTKIKRGNWKKR